MGIKERKIRLQGKLKNEILCAAMDIVKSEGADALSLRKLADKIEYTAPVIYSYFKDKRALQIALCNTGYEELITAMQNCNNDVTRPVSRLIALLTTFWSFAIEQKELYLLMYQSGVFSEDAAAEFPGLQKLMNYVERAIAQLLPHKDISYKELRCKAYAGIGLIHGLVSANAFWKTDQETSLAMRMYLINAFVNSLIIEFAGHNYTTIP